MLESIRIRNFALLENAVMRVGKGFNVITGETGAGKSILIGALSMVLGERVGREIVRTGEESCEVEAVFLPGSEKKIIEFVGRMELNSDELVVRRIFEPDGRSSCFINDRRVTLATVKSLGDILVDIHSQNQHQALLDPSRQLELLDDYAKLGPLFYETGKAWKYFSGLEEEKSKIIQRQKKTQEEYQRLLYESGEIDAAGLSLGIEEDIDSEFRVLSSSEALRSGTGKLFEELYESEGSVYEVLSLASKTAAGLAEIEARLKKLNESLARALIDIETSVAILRDYIEEDLYEPARLEELLELKGRISTLKRKYGSSLEEVLSYRDEIGKRLLEFESFSGALEKLENAISEAGIKYDSLSASLFKKRKDSARRLSGEVNARLRFLGMEQADFKAEVKTNDPGVSGGSRAQFMIRTNPGTPRMDLRKVASGGEVSRIMLAIKSALAEADDVPVLIFDEIDSGIGADTASAVAEEMKRLAGYHTVIAVTHLPQIAGRADFHLRVRKKTGKDNTFTVIESLDREGRIKELARMLGSESEEMPLKHARRLIEKNG